MGTLTRSRRLVIALAVNLALVGLQALFGIEAHSMGLLADAGHNLTDAAGLLVSLIAVRFALRPRRANHSFGYHRGTILAALANAGLIAVVTLVVAAGSIERLIHPVSVDGTTVIVVALVALGANLLAASVLRDRSHDLNMRVALLHMAGDAAASLAVAAGGALIVADPSARWADPAASLVVAVLIVIEAWVLLRGSIEVLLESSPAGMDLAALTSAMAGVPGVAEVHDLHVWSLSSEVTAMSAHVVLNGHPTLEEANVIGQRVKDAVVDPFSIAHATIELECERCIDGTEDPCIFEPVRTPEGSLLVDPGH